MPSPQAFISPIPLRRPRPSLPLPLTSPTHPPNLFQMSSASPDPNLSLSGPESIVLRTDHHDRQVLAASHNPRTISEITTFIADLRRQKLSLLIADFIARVEYELTRFASRDDLCDQLAVLDRLSMRLLREPEKENELRGEMKGQLWQLRELLEPLNPSESLRMSLEVARSGFLDIPGRLRGKGDLAKERSEMYALMVENVLLEELRSLRFLERQMNATVAHMYPYLVNDTLLSASEASALLGIDDYRVRGKTRLAEAVVSIRESIIAQKGSVESKVESAIQVLHNALVESLKTDLDVRQPAGEAMLLRPRMDDIPNFAVVNQGILRGGQPSSRGLEWLTNYGVRLVVDLRGSDRANQWEMPKCRFIEVRGEDGAVKEPMQVCNIPVEDFDTPSFEQVYDFIKLLKEVERDGGVSFVHCKAGIGRTGTMIACWRIHQGENVNSAIAKEALYSEAGGGLRQEKFVREFAALHVKEES